MVIVNLYKVVWKKKYTITKLTKGEHVDLKLSTLEKIAKFFNCSVLDILEEVED